MAKRAVPDYFWRRVSSVSVAVTVKPAAASPKGISPPGSRTKIENLRIFETFANFLDHRSTSFLIGDISAILSLRLISFESPLLKRVFSFSTIPAPKFEDGRDSLGEVERPGCPTILPP